MGLTTNLQRSGLLPALDGLSENLTRQIALNKQQNDLDRVQYTASKIADMYSSIGDNPSLEQITNATKAATALAIGNNAMQALEVVKPLTDSLQQVYQNSQGNRLTAAMISSNPALFGDISTQGLDSAHAGQLLSMIQQSVKTYETKPTATTGSQAVTIRPGDNKVLSTIKLGGADLTQEADMRFNEQAKLARFQSGLRMSEYNNQNRAMYAGNDVDENGNTVGVWIDQKHLSFDENGVAKIQMKNPGPGHGGSQSTGTWQEIGRDPNTGAIITRNSKTNEMAMAGTTKPWRGDTGTLVKNTTTDQKLKLNIYDRKASEISDVLQAKDSDYQKLIQQQYGAYSKVMTDQQKASMVQAYVFEGGLDKALKKGYITSDIANNFWDAHANAGLQKGYITPATTQPTENKKLPKFNVKTGKVE